MTRSLRPSGRDGGFTLIETVAAVVLMGIVLTGVAGVLIRSTSSAAQIARTNVAAQLADQQMELVRSIKPSEATPYASKLLAGRTQAAVQAQWATAPAALAQTTPIWATAATGAVAVPYEVAQTVDGQPYRLRTFIGTCTQAQNPTTGAFVGPCANTVTTGVRTYRILVQVLWQQGATATCGAGACEFLLTTLVNADGDQIFNTGADTTGPSGAADAVTVPFNTTSASFTVLTNDTPGGNGFATNPVGVVQQPQNGTLSASQATGTMTYTPNTNFHGQDGFVYKLTDASGLVSQEVLVTITVSRPPPPTATNRTITGVRGSGVSVTVLSPIDPLWYAADAVTVVTAPASGAGVTAAGGVLTYTAPSTWAGTEAFTYRITDRSGQTAQATVTATTPQPVAANDAATASRTTAVDVDVRANDGPDFATATVTLVTSPTAGTATVVSNRVRYTASPTTSATSDTFTYRVTNGSMTATATLTMTIPALPRAADDTATASRTSAVDIDVRANDPAEYASGTVTITSAPTRGTASVVNNQVRYTPTSGTTATSDSLVYQVVGGGLTSTATVSIAIPALAGPTAAPRNVCFDRANNVDVAVNLLALVTGNGVTGSSLSIVTGPAGNYTLRQAPAPSGTVIYRTTSGNLANSSFVYQVVDSGGLTAQGTVSLFPGTTC